MHSDDDVNDKGAIERATVVVTTDEHAVNEAVVRILAKDGRFYVRAGQLVRIVTGAAAGATDRWIQRPADLPRILPAKPVLRDEMTRLVEFVSEQTVRKNTIAVPAHPPGWCVDNISNRGDWPGMKRLNGLVTCPVLRPDGSILEKPGYDPESGLYLEYHGQPLGLPERPTQDDARAAAKLLAELVTDFPFETECALAAWVACVLSPFARQAIDGPVPLFLIDANTRGSGKTLLADVAGMIFTGSTIPRMSSTSDDEEFRKRITALARGGDSTVLIDNVAGTLGCQSLDAALTSTSWKDRTLGVSEIAEYPMDIVWIATGNNVAIGADTARRTCHIRLQSKLEKPEERDDFQKPRLLDHVRGNLREYRAAALTILGTYVEAGRPVIEMKHWGSFEGWSNLIRNAVVYAGLKDPGETRKTLAKRSDSQAEALLAFTYNWPMIDPERKGRTAAQILGALSPDECSPLREAILELCSANGDALPSPRSLGNRLKKLIGVVVRGNAISSRDSHGTSIWLVAPVT